MVTNASPNAGAAMNRQQRRHAARLAKGGARGPGRARTRSRGFGSATAGELQAAVELHQAGDFQAASGIYHRILDRHPDHDDALHLLGLVSYQAGQNDTAVELIGRALAINPKFAEAHNSLGAALQAQGKADEAFTCYQRAIANNSHYVEAHNNLGNILKDQGKNDEAMAQFGRALVIDPNYAAAHNNLGNLLQGDGKLGEAISCYRSALAIDPKLTEAHNGLGTVLHDTGDLNEAVVCYRRAISITPGHAESHNNLGKTLIEQGELDEAITHLQLAMDSDPGFAVPHSNLGALLRTQGKLDEAATSCRRAITLDPSSADAQKNFGNVLVSQGKIDDAVATYRRAVELKPDFSEAHYNLLFIMSYDARYSVEEIFTESRNWNAAHAAPRAERIRPLHNDPDPERRLRIGYVSPDLRAHSVSFFIDPLLASHDREKVEVFCYAEVPCPDEITVRFQGLADGWCSTVGLTDAELAERIRKDRIDILIDLAGHTSRNRLLVFAERPAPVQVTWLGYGATTGMTEMDYRLTDAVVDPVEEAGEYYTETLARLPNAFLCYAPTAEAPEVAPLPALTNGQITFGSFNNPSKTGPKTVEVWARVLQQVPGSRLLMKNSQLRDESRCEKFREDFAAHGIDGERIEFMPKIPAISDHLAAYGRVDIALDSFPYNGATTTLEAAWMGVPTIALRGDRFVSRMGASILTQLGLTDLLAETTEDYVERAVALARDGERLAELRRQLRPRLQASPLCDAQTFAHDVEAAYRDMWRSWCDKEADRE